MYSDNNLCLHWTTRIGKMKRDYYRIHDQIGNKIPWIALLLRNLHAHCARARARVVASCRNVCAYALAVPHLCWITPARVHVALRRMAWRTHKHTRFAVHKSKHECSCWQRYGDTIIQQATRPRNETSVCILARNGETNGSLWLFSQSWTTHGNACEYNYYHY